MWCLFVVVGGKFEDNVILELVDLSILIFHEEDNRNHVDKKLPWKVSTSRHLLDITSVISPCSSNLRIKSARKFQTSIYVETSLKMHYFFSLSLLLQVDVSIDFRLILCCLPMSFLFYINSTSNHTFYLDVEALSVKTENEKKWKFQKWN